MSNNVFPLPFEIHLAFVIIAIAVFSVRFMMKKRSYQIIMSAAVALTLFLHDGISKTMYNCVGVSIFILIIGAFVSCIIDRKKLKAMNANENGENNEDTQVTDKAEE